MKNTGSVKTLTVASFLGFATLTLLVLTAPVKALDRVRLETNVDAAVARYGVTGSGVLVAIMDRGIDWRNNDFRNADGTTRIAAIFDLTDDSGALSPGNPYGKGTLYSRAEINVALQGGPSLATRDAVGHGTTTAGIAAGNGRNSIGGKYRGIAPNATLLIIKITSDGAPAHDDQSAESPFFDGSRIPIAIDFITAQAASLGMPCVMLLNLGSQGGPTDGTSSLARKIDSAVGPGIPGLIFVTGTGDEGGMPNRTGGTLAQDGNAQIQIQKGAPGPLFFDLWYPGTDRFDVTLVSPSTTYGPYTSPQTNSQSDVQATSEFTYYQLGSNLVFYGAQNGKREIWVQLNGPAGIYTVTLHGRSVTSGRFDGTINPSFFWNPPYDTNRFLNFIAPGSIWDGATARNNIVPTSYVVRTTWTDIDGIGRSLLGQGSPGEIWRGSSAGPTFDGRVGVDVAAPGDRIVTSYNPKSYWATFRGNLINDGGGLYGIAGAVSAANPIVTGVIALMLEKNPRLDAPTVKRLLQQNARADSFTGAVPNATWGYGKLNALAVLDAVASLPSSAAPGDFDGDRRSDIAVFRPSSGAWYIRGATVATTFGGSGDIPLGRDYDGDGQTDIAVFRPATGVWFIWQSRTQTGITYTWGGAGDIPVPADYDGDGRADIAVFRPATGVWFIWQSRTQTGITYTWGGGADIPVPRDYDGDGKTDIAVFRPAIGVWFIWQSRTQTGITYTWGGGGDIPVQNDYDGDGKADVAVFRPATGFWFIWQSATQTGITYTWGGGADIPVPGDYDGDGKIDIAVFRPATGAWYVWQSNTQTGFTTTWGGGGDIPILKRP